MDNRTKLGLLKEKKKREQDLYWKDNFLPYAEKNIRILPKDPTRGFIPFKLNAAQAIAHEKIEEQRLKTGKVRALILKARQQGFSTYCASRVFWKTMYTPNSKSVVLAHDSATSDALFNMSKNIIDNLEDPPELERSNAKEILFAKNKAGYRLYTAGSPEAGRGTTPTILHCSEVAFWTHDTQIIRGLFQGVADVPGTEIILESTANGASGEFHELYQKAVAGENEFIAIFIPWYTTEEYSTSLPNGFELTPEEEDYKEKYSLSDEQIYWRRLKIGASNLDSFRQEYPANPEEAFLVSGNYVFNPEKVAALIPVNPLVTKIFNEESCSYDESNRGQLKIFKYPKFEESFIVAADVALGTKQDYSTAIVLDKAGAICATYRDNSVDPSQFGDHLFYLGRYYNNALLAVESNSLGIATINRLKQMQYVNLYHQTKVGNTGIDEDGLRVGFRTTSSSKPMVIGQLKRAIEDDEVWIPSKELIQELKVYVSNEKGQTGALNGHHDDLVMALAIAWEVRRTHITRMSTNRIGFRTVYIPKIDHNWL